MANHGLMQKEKGDIVNHGLMQKEKGDIDVEKGLQISILTKKL